MELEEAGTEKRTRKATTFFKAPAVTVKKAIVTTEGTGIKLGENPHFCKDLEAIKSDNEVCKALHQVMYNSVGKKADMKKNLRAFSGFAPELKDDKKSKVIEKKKVWTTAVLKTALGMLGLEKGGDRDTLAGRMIDYLAEPCFTKEAGTSKKRKSTAKSSSKKGAKKSKVQKDGKKRAPSAYILFCKDQRLVLRAEKPDLSMIEQTRVMGALWNALTDEAKEVLRTALMSLISPHGLNVSDLKPFLPIDQKYHTYFIVVVI